MEVSDFSFRIQERPKITNGQATVEYNQKTVLSSTYTCKTEVVDKNTKKVIDLSIDNEVKPIGVHYSHYHEYLRATDEYKVTGGSIEKIGLL